MDYRDLKGTRHYVFDNEREYYQTIALAQTPRPDWREANEGDWVWSDDDRIVQLLKVGSFKHRSGKTYKSTQPYDWCRTIVGTFLRKPEIKMDTDFSKHKNRYSFFPCTACHLTKMKNRKKVTPAEMQFVANLVANNGKNAIESYKIAFPDAKSDAYIRSRITLLMSQERIWKMIKEKTKEASIESGADEKYVFMQVKEIISDKKVAASVKLDAIKELIALLDMRPEERKAGKFAGFGLYQQVSATELSDAVTEQVEGGHRSIKGGTKQIPADVVEAAGEEDADHETS